MFLLPVSDGALWTRPIQCHNVSTADVSKTNPDRQIAPLSVKCALPHCSNILMFYVGGLQAAGLSYVCSFLSDVFHCGEHLHLLYYVRIEERIDATFEATS